MSEDRVMNFEVDSMGRKELQSLAKKFEIKANQKSDILRERIREAVAASKDESIRGNENERGVSSKIDEKVEDSLSSSEQTNKNPQLVRVENPGEDSSCANGDASNNTADSFHSAFEEENSKDTDYCANNDSMTNPSSPEQKENDEHDVNLNIGHNSEVNESNPRKSQITNDKNMVKEDIECSYYNEVQNEVLPLATTNTMSKNLGGIDVSESEGTEEIITCNSQTKNEERSVLEGDLRVDEKLIKTERKNSQQKKFKKDKGGTFHTNLPSLASKTHKKEENRTSEVSVKAKKRTKTVQQRKDVPSLKTHSKDFIRKDPTKIHAEGKENKKTAKRGPQASRQPFQDRLNRKAERMKESSRPDVKKVAPKQMAMSKRNEDQMKKFLERQSRGRKDRAERERVRIYANFCRE